MARQKVPVPTRAPAHAALSYAPIPPPPTGLNATEGRKWQEIHHFRNIIDAIRNHLQPAGTQTPHLNQLTWLYFNQHIAENLIGGITESRYMTRQSLFSRYSKDQGKEANIHLASIGFPGAPDGATRLKFWNWHLWAHGLPEVDTVGTGLPETLRGDRQGSERMGAAALMNIFRAEVFSMLATVNDTQAGGEVGPSTAASRADTRSPAAAGPSSLGTNSDDAEYEGAGGRSDDRDDEGQPAKKRQGLDDDDDVDEENMEWEAEEEENEEGDEEGEEEVDEEGDEKEDEKGNDEGDDRWKTGEETSTRKSQAKGKGKEKASR